MVRLATFLYAGNGVKKDDAECARWLRKAANKGNQEAISFLRAIGL